MGLVYPRISNSLPQSTVNVGKAPASRPSSQVHTVFRVLYITRYYTRHKVAAVLTEGPVATERHWTFPVPSRRPITAPLERLFSRVFVVG